MHTSNTQQYTMAFEQLMAQYAPAAVEERAAEEDEMDMTSDLSGVVNTIMAPYKAQGSDEAGMGVDVDVGVSSAMEFTRVFDALATTATAQSPAPMELTKSYTAHQGSDEGAMMMELTGTYAHSHSPMQQAASPMSMAMSMEMEMTATFDALSAEQRTQEMEFTRAHTPFKARDDSTAMELTEVIRHEEQEEVKSLLRELNGRLDRLP